MASRTTPAIMVIGWVTLVGCDHSAPPAATKTFEIVLRAASDEGLPVEGVEFKTASANLGKSGPDGSRTVKLDGAEGQSLSIATTCPEGYVPPDNPTPLRLTKVRRVNQDADAPIVAEVVCTRKARDVMVVVRTTPPTEVPLEIAGKAAGRVDADGAAEVRLQLDRGVKSLKVALLTEDLPKLRPKSPSRTFDLDGQDAVLLVEQHFTAEKEREVPRGPVKPKTPERRIPVRIESDGSNAF